MDINNYLPDGEKPVAESQVYEGAQGGTAGRLGLTPKRLAFVGDDAIVDVSLDAIDSFEYQKATWPWKYLKWALYSLLLAVGLPRLYPDFMSQNTGIPEAVLFGGLFATAGFLALAWYYRRSQFIVYTPSGEFEFEKRGKSLRQSATKPRETR